MPVLTSVAESVPFTPVVAPEWPSSFVNRVHPRGPGPIRGPLLPAGGFGGTVTATAAAAFNPVGGANTTWAKNAAHMVLHWLATGDSALLDKANTLANQPVANQSDLWMKTAAFVIDHFWDALDPTSRALFTTRARDFITSQRNPDINFNVGQPGGWSDMAHEGWASGARPGGVPWLAVVCSDSSDPTWNTLLEWLGEVLFLRYVPYHWVRCVGPDGRAAYDQQNYWDSAIGGPFFHLQLLISIITGRDAFTVPELGGWYGRMWSFVNHLRLTDGRIANVNKQGNTYVTGPNRAAPGFPYFHALAWAIREPVALRWCDQDGFNTLTKMIDNFAPWCYWPDPAAPRVNEDPMKVVRFPIYLAARQNWGEDATIVHAYRGPWRVGHHFRNAPGHFMIWAGGGQVIGTPWHYRYGDLAEVTIIPEGDYNGMTFKDPADPMEVTNGPSGYPQTYFVKLVRDGPRIYTVLYNDGGPNRLGNPFDYRPSQNPSGWVANLYQNLLHISSRRWKVCDHLFYSANQDTGDFIEVSEWKYYFEDWHTTEPLPPGVYQEPGQAFSIPFPIINGPNHAISRPTRANKWIRAIIFLDGNFIVVDEYEPANATIECKWQIHTKAVPEEISEGLWKLSRHEDYVYVSSDGHPPTPGVNGVAFQDDFDFALPPYGTHNRVVSENSPIEYRIDHDAWVRGLKGTGTYSVDAGPEDPFRGHFGTDGAQHNVPPPAGTGWLGFDERGPNEFTTHRLRLDLPNDTPQRLIHVISFGETEVPSSTNADGSIINIGTKTISIAPDWTITVSDNTSPADLTGTATGTSSTSGRLSARRSLSGTATGTSSTSGAISILSGSGKYNLIGRATGTSSTSGRLSARRSLSGTATGTSSTSGRLSGGLFLGQDAEIPTVAQILNLRVRRGVSTDLPITIYKPNGSTPLNLKNGYRVVSRLVPQDRLQADIVNGVVTYGENGTCTVRFTPPTGRRRKGALYNWETRIVADGRPPIVMYHGQVTIED